MTEPDGSPSVLAGAAVPLPPEVTAPEAGRSDFGLLGRLLAAVPDSVYRVFAPVILGFAILAAIFEMFKIEVIGFSHIDTWAVRVLVALTVLLSITLSLKQVIGKRIERSAIKAEAQDYETHIRQLDIPERDPSIRHVVPADVGLRLPGYQDVADHAPRLIAFVSGKGGVGKSVLALGMFERFSTVLPTQLVDFDFHNKGLTSLLRLRAVDVDIDYVLEMMNGFLAMPGIKDVEPFFTGQSQGQPDERLVEGYRGLVRDFVGESASPRAIRAIRFAESMGDDLEIPGLRHPLRPFNAQFVPSVRSKEIFLGSPSSEANSWHVYLFLRLMALRARMANAVLHQIVDCHGAHDVLTAGLICAASHLVIVGTPDMGSLEGTYELLRYSLGLRKNAEDMWGRLGVGRQQDQRIVLVVNRCLADDPNAAQLERKWGDKLDRIVRIQRSERIERLGRGYRFGDVSRDTYLRERIDEIRSALRL